MKNSRREQIMAALLTSPTVREASEACGIPETTIYTWLRKEDFKQEYKECRAEMVQESVNCFQTNLHKATKVIFELVDDDEAPPQTRLNAARTALEYCYKFTEQQEVLDRIEALERLTMGDNGSK